MSIPIIKNMTSFAVIKQCNTIKYLYVSHLCVSTLNFKDNYFQAESPCLFVYFDFHVSKLYHSLKVLQHNGCHNTPLAHFPGLFKCSCTAPVPCLQENITGYSGWYVAP